MKSTLVALFLVAVSASAQSQGNLNLYCSSASNEWCQAMATNFTKATGIKVAVLHKATGEMMAQVKAEAANPRGDVWWAGPGDAYLQAGEEGLLETYQSPNLNQLHDWAAKEAARAGYKSVGIYGGILALAYNTEWQTKRKVTPPACWKDLAKPEYKGEIQFSNPTTSGTSYMMVATLVQALGEEEAFKLMKAIHPNVNQYTRSGVGPMRAAARGETGIALTVMHGVASELVAGFPVKAVIPCEGVGYEVAGMGIIKGARNLDNAKKFYDWALTADAQKLGFEVKQYPLPSNKSVVLPPQVTKLSDIKLLDYDFARFGKAAERKRLLDRWQKEIGEGIVSK